jgi:hypothetical protein
MVSNAIQYIHSTDYTHHYNTEHWPIYYLKNLNNFLTPRGNPSEKLIVTKLSRNFPYFMEPERSLECSQEPVTGPYSQYI